MSFVTRHYHGASIFSKNGEHVLTKVPALCKIPFGQLLDNHYFVRMKFNSCKMQCSEWRNIPRANAWCLAERLGLARTALLTVSAFPGVRTQRGRPGGFLFITDPVVLNASTHRSIVFWSRIAPRHSTLNFQRKRRTVTTESLFLKKTARQQIHDALRSNAPWLLKLHCLSCPPAHAQRHQPHPCRVLAIWKTCVSCAPPCISNTRMNKSTYCPSVIWT